MVSGRCSRGHENFDYRDSPSSVAPSPGVRGDGEGREQGEGVRQDGVRVWLDVGGVRGVMGGGEGRARCE